MANDNSTDNLLRAVLGSNLQTGAARAVLILAAFSFLGACLAYLLH